jgi:hyperosmotically inducible protein
MIHLKTLTTASIAIALVIVSSACVATRTQKTLGETIDDGTITTRVKAALIANAATEARNINVDTRRGVVQLNGFVETAPGRAAAVRTASEVSGVKSVENNLELKGAERSVGETIDDGVITSRVKLSLGANPATKALEIKVETHSGRVQLGGWVDSADMRATAGRVATAVDGVTSVENNLDIKR